MLIVQGHILWEKEKKTLHAQERPHLFAEVSGKLLRLVDIDFRKMEMGRSTKDGDGEAAT